MDAPKRYTHLHYTRRRLGLAIRLTLLGAVLLFSIRDGKADTSRQGVILAQVRGIEFNYIAWELETLWAKAKQTLWGFQPYISDTEGKSIVINYLITVGQIIDLNNQIEAVYASPAPDPTLLDDLRHQRNNLESNRRELQEFAEPIIERQVATVLQEEGFGIGGQVLPPVSFRFVETPDVLVVSPRRIIQQDYSISLQPLSIEERAQLEAGVERVSPDDAAYVTGVGGVGIWPAMIVETRYTAIAFEIVAHEWSHHYLFFYPLGLEYLVKPETRFINETAATIFGNTMALKVLERFYADEVAQGLIWVPDYPTLEDFYGGGRLATPVDPDLPPSWTTGQPTAEILVNAGYPAAAQWILDSIRPSQPPRDFDLLMPATASVEINRTRITADYLLRLGYVDAAEDFMESRRQLLGLRVLNQAWFAFNGGYQADPGQGGGVSLGVVLDVTDPAYVGDPIGPALYEILALSNDLHTYLARIRDVTNRQELLAVLIEMRREEEIK
ncbi:MAG: hypothetical protein H6673_09595 [Anaerolineales bacterium]|nr:hypothetical protein [Anaerolineales bacterium]